MHSIQSDVTSEIALSEVTFVFATKLFQKCVFAVLLFISPSSSTSRLNDVDKEGVDGGKQVTMP